MKVLFRRLAGLASALVLLAGCSASIIVDGHGPRDDQAALARAFNPEDVYPPFGRYSHGVEVKSGARWLYAAGQVGVTLEGVAAEGFEAQARQALANVEEILEGAGMTWSNVIRLNAFLVDPTHVATWSRVRGQALGDALPVGTLLIVKSLAGPQWLVEIEVTAAAPPSDQ